MSAAIHNREYKTDDISDAVAMRTLFRITMYSQNKMQDCLSAERMGMKQVCYFRRWEVSFLIRDAPKKVETIKYYSEKWSVQMENLIEYKHFLLNQELSDATIVVYMRIAKKFMQYIDNRQINKHIVLEYKKILNDSRLAVTTINQHIIAVNRYLRFCGYSDCVMKTYRIQRKRSLSNVITDEDYQKMLIYVKGKGDDKYYAIMKTLALTGIRVSELSYITVENIGEGHIIVFNKGKVREIFLPDRLITILNEYCVQHQITEGCIFRGNMGKPISREAVWKKINRIAAGAGIDTKKAHPHSFRHYFALLYLKKFSNMFELADILGHASLETTRIYATATVEDKRRRMELLDN